MNKLIENQLSAYLSSQSRNKIVFYKNSIIDITAIDLGSILAQAIYNYKDASKLPMRVSAEIDKILNLCILEHNTYGRMLAITNIGILLEPELKQDFNRLLDNYSNNNILFVHWEGEIDSNYLYFQTKEQGKKIRINNLSHIAL